jgi:hypothetical protein
LRGDLSRALERPRKPTCTLCGPLPSSRTRLPTPVNVEPVPKNPALSAMRGGGSGDAEARYLLRTLELAGGAMRGTKLAASAPLMPALAFSSRASKTFINFIARLEMLGLPAVHLEYTDHRDEAVIGLDKAKALAEVERLNQAQIAAGRGVGQDMLERLRVRGRVSSARAGCDRGRWAVGVAGLSGLGGVAGL